MKRSFYIGIMTKILSVFILMNIVVSLKNTFIHNLKNSRNIIKDSTLIQNTNGYRVNKILKRNVKLYTQGLFFEDDGLSFYESGGMYGVSSINHFEFPSLKEIKSRNLEKKYFAEGIAKCGDNIFQLTWREKKILKYKKDDFSLVQEIPLMNGMREGWGLSSFKKDLLLSTDGSNKIFVLDCLNNLEKIDILNVTYNGQYLDNLNDLIFVDGFIYLNRYHDTRIFKIDSQNGKVLKAYEMRPLVNHELQQNTLQKSSLFNGYVLNGIAYNPVNRNFLLTGKRWGHYYEVDFQ